MPHTKRHRDAGLLPLPTPSQAPVSRETSTSRPAPGPPTFIPYDFFHPPVIDKSLLQHTYTNVRVELIGKRMIELFNQYNQNKKACDTQCESVYKYMCFLLHLPVLRQYVADITAFAKKKLECKAIVMGGFALRHWCGTHHTQDIDIKLFPLPSYPNDPRFASKEASLGLEESVITFTQEWQKNLASTPRTKPLTSYKQLSYTLENKVFAPVITYFQHHGPSLLHMINESADPSIDPLSALLQWMEHMRQTIRDPTSVNFYNAYLQISRAPGTGVLKVLNPGFNLAVSPDPSRPVRASLRVPMVDITIYHKGDETYDAIMDEYQRITSSSSTPSPTPPTTFTHKWRMNVPCTDWLIAENNVLLRKYTALISDPTLSMKEAQEASRFMEKFTRTKDVLDARQADKHIPELTKRRCTFPNFW